jgi:hypothetical protein
LSLPLQLGFSGLTYVTRSEDERELKDELGRGFKEGLKEAGRQGLTLDFRDERTVDRMLCFHAE